MGSWSESCGFSGIEIGDGEKALVGLLGKPKYQDFGGETHFQFKSPLILGEYNDYGYLKVADDEGVIALFNKMTGLELKNGDDFSGRDEHFVAGMQRYWIREDVFNTLPELKQEFPYSYRKDLRKSVKVKNIGEAADLHIGDLAKAASMRTAKFKEWSDMKFEKEISDEQRLELARSLFDLSLTDVLGYQAKGIIWVSVLSDLPDNIPVNSAIEAYRRYFILTYAADELRKKFAPSEKGGPQHSGEIASCQFARSILKIQAERRKRWDD